MNSQSEEWMADSVCSTVDPEIWFPDRKRDPRLKLAIRLCNECPVILQCADYAKRTGQSCGVWGGKLIGINPKLENCFHVAKGEVCRVCQEINKREREARKEAEAIAAKLAESKAEAS